MAGTLVIRLKGMGDIIHTIPALRALRRHFPDEPLVFLCLKPFGEIIPPSLKIKTWQIPPNQSFIETLALIKKIKSYKFDRLIDFFCNPRTAIISAFSGIPFRAGFGYRIRKYAYNFNFIPSDSNMHLFNLFNEFLSAIGLPNPDPSPPKLELDKLAIKQAETILHANNVKKPLLGINIHATYPSKAWPSSHFIKFITLWYQKFKTKVILFWGPGEKENTLKLAAQLPSESFFIHPPINIKELIALISKLDLFLTADTGPMNIAWALGTPTTALFGPTTRKAVAPRGEQHLVLYHQSLKCLECHKEVCSDGRCMSEMNPQWVFEKILEKYFTGEKYNAQ